MQIVDLQIPDTIHNALLDPLLKAANRRFIHDALWEYVVILDHAKDAPAQSVGGGCHDAVQEVPFVPSADASPNS